MAPFHVQSKVCISPILPCEIPSSSLIPGCLDFYPVPPSNLHLSTQLRKDRDQTTKISITKISKGFLVIVGVVSVRYD